MSSCSRQRERLIRLFRSLDPKAIYEIATTAIALHEVWLDCPPNRIVGVMNEAMREVDQSIKDSQLRRRE